MKTVRKWWGSYDLAPAQVGNWRIGPLELFIHRQPSELLVAWTSKGDPKDESATVEIPAEAVLPLDASTNRFIFTDTAMRVDLRPRLADRPVIIRPETPLYIPAGENVTLFVGSPVWVVVAAGDPPRVLTELQAYRSTDSWSGPNTREGELCYGSRTLARLRIEDCTIRPHRAISAVEVRNEAPNPLLLEHIKLPAPNLALFATEEGVLWTQAVSLVRGTSGDRTEVRISDAPHPHGGVLKRLAEPREMQRENFVFETFNKLFG